MWYAIGGGSGHVCGRDGAQFLLHYTMAETKEKAMKIQLNLRKERYIKMECHSFWDTWQNVQNHSEKELQWC